MEPIQIVRTLRTNSSERFLVQRNKTDVAALELHYLHSGSVQATLILFDGSGIGESEVPGLLTWLDEVLLPDVALTDRNLAFTVVIGRVLGAFQPSKDNSTH